MKVGVLALQGASARHVAMLAAVGAAAIEVKTPERLADVDRLVMPGGESTTMSKLLVSNDLVEPVQRRLAAGMPVLGTCAGMILLASEVLDGRSDQIDFGAIDISVRRNGFGRQLESFEADLTVDALGPPPVRGVFIRAPRVERVGAGVEVIARLADDEVVACRQENVVVTSFHPELTDDTRLHEWFVTTAF
ncbi:MAG: pyridoxal 5'-phosphate synthase glutaminase subunit PdxT [Acidimicrobiia bacterium]|nr:pyridoxal 5'-phosphate synthase glutaminase subunit PdxT [Acidimicrobiia bacterium]